VKIDNKEEKGNICEHDEIKIRRCNKTDERGRSEDRERKENIHLKIIAKKCLRKCP